MVSTGRASRPCLQISTLPSSHDLLNLAPTSKVFRVFMISGSSVHFWRMAR
ncbi:hypothetical protein BD413DRAFT_469181 [Trametes elegans]|nr:hypothetical protein BD413DRAFT_469181 [Trametes elegans]